MSGCGKAAHIRPNLRQQFLTPSTADTGYSVHQLGVFLERAHALPYLLVQAANLFLQEVQVTQVPLEEKTLVGTYQPRRAASSGVSHPEAKWGQ